MESPFSWRFRFPWILRLPVSEVYLQLLVILGFKFQWEKADAFSFGSYRSLFHGGCPRTPVVIETAVFIFQGKKIKPSRKSTTFRGVKSLSTIGIQGCGGTPPQNLRISTILSRGYGGKAPMVGCGVITPLQIPYECKSDDIPRIVPSSYTARGGFCATSSGAKIRILAYSNASCTCVQNASNMLPGPAAVLANPRHYWADGTFSEGG